MHGKQQDRSLKFYVKPSLKEMSQEQGNSKSSSVESPVSFEYNNPSM